uniref:RNA-directed RNA polymerase n=1 Tax=Hammarskog noda-like virus TaxID=2665439 RepID=A0A5Q0V1B1_9VIRU|nr:hypothetical protein [Hammarskog noda-like virus]
MGIFYGIKLTCLNRKGLTIGCFVLGGVVVGCLFRAYARSTVRRVTIGDKDYRPRNSYTGVAYHLIPDLAMLLWNGTNIRMRSKYAASRRTKPEIDFRHNLHHPLRDIRAIRPAINHTHPLAACLRTSTAISLEDTIRAAGFKPYSVSMSNRDKYSGCRYFYMMKDLDKEYKDDPVAEDHVIIMVDVDYYVDINEYLRLGNPIIIYTFVPSSAGGTSLNASYTINEKNMVEYSVEGGATYTHQLWDYQGDNIAIRDRYGNTIVYVIEQHILEADPNRRIIGLYPVAHFPLFTTPYAVEVSGIKRLTPYNGSVVCVRNKSAGTMSIASAGSMDAIDIPQRIYDALLIRRATSKNPLISDVERILNSEKIEDAATKAPLLFKLLSAGPVANSSTVTSTAILPVRNFQTTFPLVHEDGKSVGRAVAPSLVTEPAVVPAKSYNNDYATVEGRIRRIRNNVRTPPEWKRYDTELVNFIVPPRLVATGTPLDYERVIELQARPAQRGRSAQAIATLSSVYINKVKAFIKAEAYPAITDPRNISTVDQNHQLTYSRYTYAFKEDCLKGRPWFASAMTPDQIANRVVEICGYEHGVIVSDYSRLDGHVSEDDKRFKEHVYQTWCAHAERAKLALVLAADRNPPGVTANGLKYDPGFSQLSGSPGTTNDNNLVTLRHDYIALREIGQTPEQAWTSVQLWVLGASDDRIRANIPGYADMLETVASKLGHELKSEIRYPRKGDPVAFLGRYYADPATSRDSIQDILRTLAKLHLTMSPDTTPDRQALFNRATGYLVTDKYTPILGVWCAKVVRLLQQEGYQVKNEDREEHYRIQQGPYPQEDPGLLRTLVCRLLDLESGELDAIERAIRAATSVEELPNGILDNGHTIRHRIQAVIGHDLFGPMPTVNVPECQPQATSSNCVNPETTGCDGSNRISENPSGSQSNAVRITAATEPTPEPQIPGPSRATSSPLSPPSEQIKHHPVTHSRRNCRNPNNCPHHAPKQQGQNKRRGLAPGATA